MTFSIDHRTITIFKFENKLLIIKTSDLKIYLFYYFPCSMNKASIPENETERIKVLVEYKIIDTLEEAVFDIRSKKLFLMYRFCH